MIFRHHYDRYGWGFLGGYTLAIDPERKTAGIALCSHKDQFNKKAGRELAASRANCQYHKRSADLFVISMPIAKSLKSVVELKAAMEHMLDYVTYKHPNTELWFKFE
jgi:hypothetical protein